jgi:hypothetical protein
MIDTATMIRTTIAGVACFTGIVMSFAALLTIRFRTDGDKEADHSAACFLPIIGFIICVLHNVTWRRQRGAIICLLAGLILVVGGLWTLCVK